MTNQIFVTGLYRSGTTLMDKILTNHPDIFIASQPIPFLYIYLKTEFLKEKGLNRKIPLDTLFNENDYTSEDFLIFLSEYKFDKQKISEIFSHNAKYSGCLTPNIAEIRNLIDGNLFLNLITDINLKLAKHHNLTNIQISGSKEIVCEEYIPFFLKKGIKVILLIRDIRDVICSLNIGKGEQYTGKVRPTLFNIRSWRKSVAFALNYKENKNLLFIKFEDFLYQPDKILNTITDFLEVDQYKSGFFNEKILDQNGSLWKGNSSFKKKESISSDSIGKYKSYLSEEYIDYIETLCYSELKTLGYSISCSNPTIKVLKNFKEPFTVNHTLFDSDYSNLQIHIDEEVKRLMMLQEQVDAENIKQYFIYEKTYQILKSNF